MRTVLIVLCAAGLAMAEDPPRNQVPHIPPELERLRAITRDQQLRTAKLESMLQRMERDHEQLKAELEKSQKSVAALQAELERERTQSQTLRGQLSTLEREVYRPRGNRKELVGAWKVLSVEENGEKRPQPVTRLMFTPSSVAFHRKEPGQERIFPYKVSPDEQPKEIDILGGDTRPTLGIYELKDDRLTLCIDHRLLSRPSEFQSKAESGIAVWILGRQTPPREGATLQADNSPTALARGD